MQKLCSQIIGMPVFDEYTVSPVALVKDVLIDPETGNVVAFILSRRRILVPMDVRRMTSAIYIRDREDMSSPDEVTRVREVMQQNIPILGAHVNNTHKKFIGKVVDFEIETKTMSLTHIYTARTFFFFHLDERVFARKQIISITKKGITVKDSGDIPVKVKAKGKVTTPSPAIA